MIDFRLTCDIYFSRLNDAQRATCLLARRLLIFSHTLNLRAHLLVGWAYFRFLTHKIDSSMYSYQLGHLSLSLWSTHSFKIYTILYALIMSNFEYLILSLHCRYNSIHASSPLHYILPPATTFSMSYYVPRDDWYSLHTGFTSGY
jgi:hypothetical protein